MHAAEEIHQASHLRIEGNGQIVESV